MRSESLKTDDSVGRDEIILFGPIIYKKTSPDD